jgi:hypothetical protein
VQAALSLGASAALSGVLLAVDRRDPRSGARHPQGAWGLSASAASLLDAPASGPVAPVGCRSGHDAEGDGNPAHASPSSGQGPGCERGEHVARAAWAATSLGPHDAPRRACALDLWLWMVRVLARWARVRIPLALAPMAPKIKGPPHRLCRQMVQDCGPPGWARRVVGMAEAGCAANATLRLRAAKHSGDVVAMPRTRQLTNGQHLRDLGQHLPKSYY